jgi:hypothetical protein
MRPCACGTVPTTSSDITYSVVWCPGCRKTLSAKYPTPEEAILAYDKGPEKLPPNCPFCYWPPNILNPDGQTQISCHMPCPIEGRVFTLEEWNRTRPRTTRLDELVQRWEKRSEPHMKNALKALKRAIAAHVKQRYRDP